MAKKYEEESFQNVDIYINELIDGAGGGTPPKIPETVEEAKKRLKQESTTKKDSHKEA